MSRVSKHYSQLCKKWYGVGYRHAFGEAEWAFTDPRGFKESACVDDEVLDSFRFDDDVMSFLVDSFEDAYDHCSTSKFLDASYHYGRAMGYYDALDRFSSDWYSCLSPFVENKKHYGKLSWEKK